MPIDLSINFFTDSLLAARQRISNVKATSVEIYNIKQVIEMAKEGKNKVAYLLV
jgi:hypothetical protein